MVCPNCSHNNEAGVRFCVQCGQPLVASAPPAQQQSYPPPPQGYGYPPQGGYPPRAAAGTEGGPWILRSLPFIGAIAVLVGFFLPWFGSAATSGSAGMSGFDILRSNLDNLQYLNSSTEDYQFALINGILLGIIPIMGLAGLPALSGKKKTRTLAMCAGLTGIILQVSFVGLLILWGGRQAGGLSGFNFGLFLKFLQFGYYISLAGFLWMAITPAFAPKPR